MFAYIFTHFINHAIGNLSLDVMETWLAWHMWWWRTPLLAAVLYTAALTHFGLGLWALYQRRHFRYAAPELAQLILGLSIPLLLIGHFSIVRLAEPMFGRTPPNYAAILNTYWNV